MKNENPVSFGALLLVVTLGCGMAAQKTQDYFPFEYRERQPGDQETVEVDGVPLSVFEVDHVYFATNVGGNRLIAVSILYPRPIRVGVVSLDKVQRTRTILFEVPDNLRRYPIGLGVRRSLKHPSCIYATAFFESGGEAANQDEYSKAYGKVFLTCGGQIRAQSPEFLYAERNVTYAPSSSFPDEPPSPYTLYARNRWPRPGYFIAGTVLLRDVNGDGWEDVVVWQKLRQARKLKPGEPKDFEFVTNYERETKYGPLVFSRPDKFLMMTFDPETNSFSELQEAKELPVPEEKLWQAMSSFVRQEKSDTYRWYEVR